MGEQHAPAEQTSSIQRALDVVGDRWTILIIRDVFRGVRRFDELRKDLDIARPILADRLKRLVEAGVLDKHRYQDRPPRFDYRLTPMGRELSPILVAFMRWGDTYLSDGPPETVLVHEACGHEFDQPFVCWHCDQTFSPLDIRSRSTRG